MGKSGKVLRKRIQINEEATYERQKLEVSPNLLPFSFANVLTK
jgi:hypothetical protein